MISVKVADDYSFDSILSHTKLLQSSAYAPPYVEQNVVVYQKACQSSIFG
jgi:hypothetical protein